MNTSKKSSNNFLIQGSILAIASIIVRLIGIIYRIPMTNIIGDEGNGYYSVAFEAYSIALILSSYSLPLAVSKLVAARNIKKQYNNAFRIFIGSMVFAITSGLILTLIIYFGADFIARFFYKKPPIAIPLKFLAPTIFIVAIMGVFRGYFQGKNTMIPTSISQILEQIVNAVVSIVAAYILVKSFSASPNVAAYGAGGGTLGTCIGALFGLIFLILVFLLYWPTIKKQKRRDKTETVESYQQIFKILILTIIPVIISQTVYQLSGFLDSILFYNIMEGKNLTDPEAYYGIYSAKYRLLTNVPVAISSSIASAMIPSIVAAFINKEHTEVTDKIQVSIKFNMIIAIPSAVGMAVLASPILKLLFSDSSKLAANLIMFGSVSIVFYALSTVTNAVLQGINYMRLPVIHSAISLGIHIVLVILLLQFFNLGVYALVIGNVTFPLVVCILNARSIYKHLGYKSEKVKTFLIPSIASLIMGVFTFLSYQVIDRLTHMNSISTLFAIMIAVITYFVSLIALKGITEEELYKIPKGTLIINLMKKFHLLK